MSEVQIMQKVQKLLSGWRNRIAMMIGRGILKAVQINNDGDLQKWQISLLSGEVISKISVLQQFGLCSTPPIDSDVLVLFVSGDRSQGIVVASESRRYRLSVNPGETIIYGKEGQYIYLKTGKEIEIGCDGKEENINGEYKRSSTSEEISISGTLKINAGGQLEIDSNTKVIVNSAAQVDVTAPTVNVTGATVANVDGTTVNVGPTSGTINLGGGGSGVARIGDTVVSGVITSGSTKVFSG